MDQEISTEPDALADEVSEELLGFVKPELQPGERLLWASQGIPRSRKAAGISPYSSDRPLLPALVALLALYLCAGVVFIAGSFEAMGPIGPPKKRETMAIGLTAIGLSSLGLAMTTYHRLRERSRDHLTAKATHALTDRRAICWKPRQGTDAHEVYSVPRGKVRDLHRVEYPDGSGDVVFGFDPETTYWYITGFEGVPGVRGVEDLVRRTLIAPLPGP